MAKNTINATMRTSKQQISKILMSQLCSYVEEICKWKDEDNIDTVKDCSAYKIVRSRARQDGRISSWTCSNTYAFRFEYGRRTNAVRVSYMNSDGLISAVFGEDEWICMAEFIEEKLDRIVEKRIDELKTEREKKEREQFELRVRAVVRNVLNEKDLRDKVQAGEMSAKEADEILAEMNN